MKMNQIKHFAMAIALVMSPVVTMAGYSIDTIEMKVKLVDFSGVPVPEFSVLLEVDADTYGIHFHGSNPIPAPGWERTAEKLQVYRTNAFGEVTIPAQSFKSISPAKRNITVKMKVGELVDCDRKQGWTTYKYLSATASLGDGTTLYDCSLMVDPERDQFKRAQGKMVCKADDDLETIERLQQKVVEMRKRCVYH